MQKDKRSLAMKITYWLKVVSLGLILGLGLQFAQAWTAPTVAPPGGNVSGPVTLGNTGQWKTGNLAINTGWDTNNDGTADTWGANGLLVPNGDVAIGTTNPWARLSVKENANSPYQGVSIMDPADHVGLYLWSDGDRARVSGCNDGNCNLLINGDGTGNVGIAISGNPTAALDVNGRIRMRQQTVAGDNADIVATKGYVDGKLGSGGSAIFLHAGTDYCGGKAVMCGYKITAVGWNSKLVSHEPVWQNNRWKYQANDYSCDIVFCTQ